MEFEDLDEYKEFKKINTKNNYYTYIPLYKLCRATTDNKLR